MLVIRIINNKSNYISIKLYIYKAIELIRDEQSLTESELALLRRGEDLSRRPSQDDINREKRIKKLVDGFSGKKDWKTLFDGIADNMGQSRKK